MDKRNEYGFIVKQEGPLYHYGGEDTWTDRLLPYLVGAIVVTVLILGLMVLSPRKAQAQVVSPAVMLKASWYSVQSLKDEGTWKTSKGVMANGHQFKDEAFTCATRLYALGARLKVTNVRNGRSVLVDVTDRISKRFGGTRIDLSRNSFNQIAELREGLVSVRVEIISMGR
jgi:hypothetical protein